MSNALGLAAVTAVLRNLLDNGLIEAEFPAASGSPVTVSALPPDRIPLEGNNATPRLNLFLYRVAANPGWQNQALPSRDPAGARITNPPLALNLHYLVTAYGIEALQAELLLGYAMHILHETPVMSRDAIRTALTQPNAVNTGVLPETYRTLAADALASQVETIKLTPHYLGTEDLSKLWTALQGHYRPSVSYEASVVLIAAQKRTRAALPVRERQVFTVPFARPLLEDLSPMLAPVGATLVLRGTNLRGAGTRVLFGATSAAPASVAADEVRVAIPATLRAGVNAVRVQQGFDFETLNEPHRGFESNSLAFLLVPTITPVGGPNFTVAAGGTLLIDVSPAIAPNQDVQLLVGDRALVLPPRTPGSAPLSQVSFTIPPGTGSSQLLRLRLDGADSPLIVDTDPSSATFNQFIGPLLTVT